MTARIRRAASVLLVLLVVGLIHPGAAGQTTGPTNLPLVISSMDGHDLFGFYCASCHGRNGKGGGPTAPALKTSPPDLTTMAKRNGGTFPRARVLSLVRGNGALTIPVHGSTEMPVWGPIFRGLDSRDHLNAIRIENLVAHIESIQAK